MEHGGALEHDEYIVLRSTHSHTLWPMLWAKAQQLDWLVARRYQFESTEVVALHRAVRRRARTWWQSAKGDDGVGDRQAGRVLDTTAEHCIFARRRDPGFAARRARWGVRGLRRRARRVGVGVCLRNDWQGCGAVLQPQQRQQDGDRCSHRNCSRHGASA
jgi:hypothetical protein